MRTRSLIAVGILLASLVPSVAGSAGGAPHPLASQPAYLDADLPIGRRVNDLLRRMTLEEKVGDDDYDPLFPYGWGLRT